MSERPVKPIPIAGSWIQNTSERAILYVSEVDAVKERIRIKRFARYGAEGPEFDGRTTWLSYETYRRGTRYMPREAPVNPDCLPEKITWEQAQEALELEGWTSNEAWSLLDSPPDGVDATSLTDRERAILRAYLGNSSPTVTPPDGMPVTEETLTREQAEERLREVAAFSDAEIAAMLDHPQATLEWAATESNIPVAHRPKALAIRGILRAYDRGQSAAKIVNLLDGPERNDVPAAQPPLADVLAAIEALRAEVRADRKPLLDAVDQVLASIEDGSALGVTRRAVALDDLRNARAKVAG